MDTPPPNVAALKANKSLSATAGVWTDEQNLAVDLLENKLTPTQMAAKVQSELGWYYVAGPDAPESKRIALCPASCAAIVSGGYEALEVLMADLRPVDRQLLVGRRVHRAADTLDLLGDLLRRRATAGALEQHVLQEVRHAGDLVLFVSRAGRHVEPHAD